MTILITGGFGFIGSYTLRALMARGDSVVVLDQMVHKNSAAELLKPEELERISVVSGDVTDPHTINRVIRDHKVRRIVHMASILSSHAAADPSLTIRLNCQGLLNVLEAAHLFSIERLVWASSCSVFGTQDRHPSGIITNDAPHYPDTVYAASKSFGERLAEHYYRALNVDSIGLRFNVVFGKGVQRGGGDGRFNKALFEKPAKGEPAEVDFGEDTFCWQHVEDAAGTVLAALDAPTTETRAFNTCGEVCSVRGITEIVKEFVPDAEYVFLPGRFNVAYNFDDGPATDELGYSGKTSLRQCIRLTLRDFGVRC